MGERSQSLERHRLVRIATHIVTRIVTRLSGILCVTGMMLAGCSGDPNLDGDADQDGNRSFGLLTVQVLAEGPVAELELAEPPAGLEVTVTAQFVRYGAMKTEQVARLLALPFDPVRDLPPVDTCAVYHLTADLTEQDVEGEQDAQVELLEAGELTVDAGRNLVLVPKYFPGLVPFVSGVVYGEAQATQTSPPNRVTAMSTGSEAVEAFRAEGISPEPLSLEPFATTSPGRGIALRWRTASRSRDNTEVAYLEIKPAHSHGQGVVRCRMLDDGAFNLDAEVLGVLHRDGGTHLILEAGRVRQMPFSVEGLDSAELRLSATERLTLP
jgi:hypothetical protein